MSRFRPLVRSFLIRSNTGTQHITGFYRGIVSCSEEELPSACGYDFSTAFYEWAKRLQLKTSHDCLRVHACSGVCICCKNFSNPFAQKMLQLQGNEPNADIVTICHSENSDTGTRDVQIMMKIFGTIRTVNRKEAEPLLRSLERIKTNVKNANAKIMLKTKKKIKKLNPGGGEPGLAEAEPIVALYDRAGEKIDEETEIITAWEQGKILKVCDFSFRVICNPPKVEELNLVKMPLVGMPLYPQLQLIRATIEHSRFEWCRKLCPVENMETDETTSQCIGGKHKMDSSDAESSDVTNDEASEWELVGTDKTYTPSVEDVGYTVKLKVTPGSGTFPVDGDHGYVVKTSCAYTEPTMEGPKKLLAHERLKHTTKRCINGSFRFVTYNILADVYAATEYAHDFLFPYCPTEAMDIDYRQQLILKELIGYNADIICLQEVDRSVFESYYMPAMSLHGYAGGYASKDTMKEGVAMFYYKEKFRLLAIDNIILRKSLKEERNADISNMVSENSTLLKNFMHKPTCLLVALLENLENGKKILLGNTHLYWHPRGCHIRLLQTELLLREMRRLHKKHSSESESVTCIITGDFNSNPVAGAVQLLTEGHVPKNHSDWYSCGKSERIELELNNPWKFRSACGYPKYTNFVTSFQNCLDYVFIDDLLEVEKVIPMPAHEDVVRYTALPNATAPSDHLPLVVEMKWKT